jgi:hypothetical protein
VELLTRIVNCEKLGLVSTGLSTRKCCVANGGRKLKADAFLRAEQMVWTLGDQDSRNSCSRWSGTETRIDGAKQKNNRSSNVSHWIHRTTKKKPRLSTRVHGGFRRVREKTWAFLRSPQRHNSSRTYDSGSSRVEDWRTGAAGF